MVTQSQALDEQRVRRSMDYMHPDVRPPLSTFEITLTLDPGALSPLESQYTSLAQRWCLLATQTLHLEFRALIPSIQPLCCGILYYRPATAHPACYPLFSSLTCLS
jgi:hypothetical protein